MKYFHRLITLVIFFFCNPLFAQKKSIPGYYITHQSDTVRGVFPRYTQWNKNPSQAEFAMEGATNRIQVTPENARKFVVEGYDEYLSYSGKRLVNPIDDAVILDEKSFIGSNDSTEKISTFLRLVKRTTGGDLYILNDDKRTNFFYQIPGQQLTELRYKKTFIEGQISDIAEYRQQLNHLFAEAIVQKNLTTSLKRLPYEEEHLSSFFQDLFPAAVQERKKQGGGTEWVVSAGVAWNMISVQAGKDFKPVPRTYASSFSPLLSVGFIVPMGRNFGKYFFYPQVKLFQYKNTGEENQGTFINTVTYQADLAVVAQVSGGLNVVNRESRRLFITGGFGALGQFGSKEVKQMYAASNRTPYLNAAETKLPTLTYSIDASVGAEVNKKIILSATYMVPTNIGNFVFYNPKLSGIQLRAGYKL